MSADSTDDIQYKLYVVFFELLVQYAEFVLGVYGRFETFSSGMNMTGDSDVLRNSRVLHLRSVIITKPESANS